MFPEITQNVVPQAALGPATRSTWPLIWRSLQARKVNRISQLGTPNVMAWRPPLCFPVFRV